MKNSILRRVVSTVLSLIVVFGTTAIAPVTSVAKWSGTWMFHNIDDDHIIIDGFAIKAGGTYSTAPVIPSVYKDYQVVGISDQSFSSDPGHKMVSITFEEGIQSIGFWAFYNCAALTTITIPSTLNEIGNSAFFGCSSLTTVNVSQNNRSFRMVNGLLCSYDNKRVITYCAGLNTSVITIPATVEEIDAAAFSGCKRITSYNVDENNQYYTSVDGVLYSKDLTELVACPAGKDYIIIPQTVERISYSAFINSDSLKVVAYEGTDAEWRGIEYSGSWTNDNLSKATMCYDSSEIISDSGILYAIHNDNTASVVKYVGSDSLVSIPSSIEGHSVTGLYYSAFEGCSTIQTVALPEGIEKIPWCAFYGSSIKNITIPNSVTVIEESAFSNCTALETITMPNNLVRLGWSVFSGCSNLSSISLPESVSEIGEKAFTGTAIYNDKSNWQNGSLYIDHCLIKADTTASGIFEIKDGTICIAENAFWNCSLVTQVVIPTGVKNFSWYDFYGCTSLSRFYLPTSILTANNNCSYKDADFISDSLVANHEIWYAGSQEEWNEIAHTDTEFATIGVYCNHSYGDDFVHISSVNATCTTDGNVDCWYCSKCEKYYNNSMYHSDEISAQSFTIPAEGHFVIIDSAVKPTCTETGLTEGSHCDVCGVVLVTQEIVPAKGHTIVNDAAIAPSCIETGLTAGNHCSTCGKIIVAQEIVSATGHTAVVDAAVAPTCTETGLTEGSHCSVCNTIIIEQITIPANGHTTVIDSAVNPTCTETGLTAGRHCSICGEVFIAQEIIPANGHTVIVDAAVAATCTQTGLTEGSHCSACGTVIVAQEIIPANSHTIVIDAAVAPTCVETGLTAGCHCPVCNAILVAQEIVPANGHTVVEDAAVAPTCTETGLTVGSHCSVCGKSIVAQEIVPATGHTIIVDAAVSPTCTETGLTEGSHCSVCSAIIVIQEVIPATGHTAVVDASVAPTCTETGLTEGRHCSVCNAILVAQEEVEATGHTIVIDDAVASTCTKTGRTEGSHCSACNSVFVAQEVIPAKGHTVVYDAAVSPTCTEPGLTNGSHCSVCGETVLAQETVQALGHTIGHATCTDDYTCEHCGIVIEYALGHNWTSGVVTKPASHTEEGILTYTCTRCNAVKTEPIPILPVADDDPLIIVKSKQTIPGNTIDIIIAIKNNPGIASLKLKVEYGNALTLTQVQYNEDIGGNYLHPQNLLSPVTLNWFNGAENLNGDYSFVTLTFVVSENAVLGSIENIIVTYDPDDVYNISDKNIDFAIQNGEVVISTYIPGDINGDGKVNNKDITRLFQYLSDWDVEVNEIALDVNGDGKINNRDLTRLFQYLSDWDVEVH